jgi:hypothetical protein
MQVSAIQTSPDAQVKVCRNKDTGEFAIIHYCRYKWPYSAVEVGKVERVKASEFAKTGLGIVRSSLEAFPTRQKSGPSELESLAEAEQRKFDADHECALVTINEDGVMLLQPFKRGDRGTYGASDSLATRLRFPIGSTRFYAAILEALERAD